MKITKILKSIHFWLYLLCMFCGTFIICLPHIANHLDVVSINIASYNVGLIACCAANLLFSLGNKLINSFKKQNEVNNGNI